jgi:hypothetical protein
METFMASIGAFRGPQTLGHQFRKPCYAGCTATKGMDTAMAKGQMKSSREAKKPKKTEAEKLKAKMPVPNLQSQIAGDKDRAKK